MRTLPVGVIWVFFVFANCLLEDEVCPRKHHALLIALLPLHKGSTCRELLQKGVQQRVALETALETLNTGNDLPIGVKILDTCSERSRASASAVRGLEFARKRCSKLPVFLGFLGPDDEESLRAMVGVHNESQIVPVAETGFQFFNGFNVEVVNAEEKAKRIEAFLRYLQWYSFILVFTSDTASSRIAMSLLESDHFCLTNSVLRIPSFASTEIDAGVINKLRRAVEEVEHVRIVVITDDPDVMSYFTDYVEDAWGGFEYVIYTERSGILPWRASRSMSRNTIILHEVPKSPLLLPNFDDTLRNSTLWTNYVSQVGGEQCGECKPPRLKLDPTLVPYVYSLHLLSRALKTAIRRKCGLSLLCDGLKNMDAAEWKSILESTVTVSEAGILRFYKKLESKLDVMVLNEEEEFETVGSVDDFVSMYRAEAVNKSSRSRTKQCVVDMYQYELEPDVVHVTTTTRDETTERAVAEEQKIPLNFGYYELMATVIGFPIGLVFLIALTVACVYRGFRSGSSDPRKSNFSGDTGPDDYN